ncbi:hypothetical protein ACOME3_006762 [Neoechinorhynchus agilis]
MYRRLIDRVGQSINHQLPYPVYVMSDLKLINIGIQEELRSRQPELNKWASYYSNSPGKMIRPAIVCSIARALLWSREQRSDSRLLRKLFKIGEITEMIHTASLIHDDVEDIWITELSFIWVSLKVRILISKNR